MEIKIFKTASEFGTYEDTNKNKKFDEGTDKVLTRIIFSDASKDKKLDTFKSFGDFSKNPSGELAKELAGKQYDTTGTGTLPTDVSGKIAPVDGQKYPVGALVNSLKALNAKKETPVTTEKPAASTPAETTVNTTANTTSEIASTETPLNNNFNQVPSLVKLVKERTDSMNVISQLFQPILGSFGFGDSTISFVGNLGYDSTIRSAAKGISDLMGHVYLQESTPATSAPVDPLNQAGLSSTTPTSSIPPAPPVDDKDAKAKADADAKAKADADAKAKVEADAKAKADAEAKAKAEAAKQTRTNNPTKLNKSKGGKRFVKGDVKPVTTQGKEPLYVPYIDATAVNFPPDSYMIATDISITTQNSGKEKMTTKFSDTRIVKTTSEDNNKTVGAKTKTGEKNVDKKEPGFWGKIKNWERQMQLNHKNAELQLTEQRLDSNATFPPRNYFEKRKATLVEEIKQLKSQETEIVTKAAKPTQFTKNEAKDLLIKNQKWSLAMNETKF